MIELQSVTKYVGRGRHRRIVLDAVDGTFAAGSHWVIFGGRGAGKTTLLGILSGTVTPTAGRVIRRGLVGPPVGSNSPFGINDTCQNIAARTARLYRADPDAVVEFTADFSQLGRLMARPVISLPPEMRSRFNFALGYALPVDYYLFDMTIAPSTEPFRSACVAAFERRRAEAATLMVTRQTRNAKDYGDNGAVLVDGSLIMCADLDEAIALFAQTELELKTGTLEYAERLIDAGDYQQTLIYLREYVLTNESDAEAFTLLGEVAFHLGRHDEAADACETAVALTPTAFEAHLLLAKIANASGRVQEAIRHAEDALTQDPENREALALLARLLENSGDPVQVEEVRPNSAAKDSKINALHATMRAEIRARHWEGALSTAQQISEEAGEDAALLHVQARASIELERFEETEAYFKRLIALDIRKALHVVDWVRRKGDLAVTLRFLLFIPPRDLKQNLGSPYLRGVLSFIRRETRVAKREGRPADVEVLSELVDSMVADPQPNSPPPSPAR